MAGLFVADGAFSWRASCALMGSNDGAALGAVEARIRQGVTLNPICMLRTASSFLGVHMLAERALRHPRFRGDLVLRHTAAGLSRHAQDETASGGVARPLETMSRTGAILWRQRPAACQLHITTYKVGAGFLAGTGAVFSEIDRLIRNAHGRTPGPLPAPGGSLALRCPPTDGLQGAQRTGDHASGDIPSVVTGRGD